MSPLESLGVAILAAAHRLVFWGKARAGGRRHLAQLVAYVTVGGPHGQQAQEGGHVGADKDASWPAAPRADHHLRRSRWFGGGLDAVLRDGPHVNHNSISAPSGFPPPRPTGAGSTQPNGPARKPGRLRPAGQAGSSSHGPTRQRACGTATRREPATSSPCRRRGHRQQPAPGLGFSPACRPPWPRSSIEERPLRLRFGARNA